MMKVTLSRRDDARGQHLVLCADRQDSYRIHDVIVNTILEGRTAPVREVIYEPSPHRATTGREAQRISYVRYRFHMNYIDKLVLTFPQVELSSAAQRFMAKRAKDVYNDADVPKIKVPGMKGKLWNFQKVSVAHVLNILDHTEVFDDPDIFGGYLNHDMGLGKTVIIYAAMSIRNVTNTLVITTNSGKWAWKRIAAEHFPSLDVAVADGTKAERKVILAEGHQITLINFEMLRTIKSGRGKDAVYTHAYPELFGGKVWDVVVNDESHKVKNPYSQQGRGFLALDANVFIPMSGTPMLNRPDELWTCMNTVSPETWNDYEGFTESLTIRLPGESKPVAYDPKVVGAVREHLQTYGLRFRKDQVLKDLPTVVPSTIEGDMGDEQKHLYEEIRDEMRLWFADGTSKTIVATIAQITRLKQACLTPELYGGSPTSAKIDSLKEAVAELVENGHKAIVFSQWSTATRIFERELAEYSPAYVDGSVTGSRRMAQVDRFNTDPECKVYIGTIGANQESITLSAADYVIFTDKAWTPLANDQAAGRSAAGGLRGAHLTKNDKVHIIYLYARGTIEESIDKLLATKAALFNNFVEVDGGRPVNRGIIDSLRQLLEAA